MSADLPALRIALKAKIPSILLPGDTLSLLWFSGRGEVGIVFEGLTIQSLGELASAYAAIDAGLRSRGLTGFRDPLEEVERIVQRLGQMVEMGSREPAVFSLLFMSDGMDNQCRRTDVMDIIARLGPKLALTTIVEYGDYADRAMLAAMAQRAGGTLVRAESLDEYVPMIEREMQQEVPGDPRIELDLGAAFRAIEYAPAPLLVFGERGDGELVTYEIQGDQIFVPGDARQVWILSAHPLAPAGRVWVDDQIVFHATTRAAYSAIALLAMQMRADLIEPLLRCLGDVRLIDLFGGCFGKQAFGRLAREAEAAAKSTALRFVDGHDPGRMPPEDATTVVDVLQILEADPHARLLLEHEAFAYRRITRAQVDRDENFSADEKAEIVALQAQMGAATQPADVQRIQAALAAILATKQARIHFTPDPSSGAEGYPIGSLVYNELSPNISLRVRKEGTVDLGARIDRDVGQIPALANLDRALRTFTYRNYAIVAHGIVHVRHLPVKISRESHDRLVAAKVPMQIVDRPMDALDTVVIDLSKLPILNRRAVARVTLADVIQTAYRLIALRARTKVWKHLVDARTGDMPVPALGRDPRVDTWLADQGITATGGFQPRRVQAESTDFILGKQLTIKIKGYSTLPTVAKVEEKRSAGGKLNGPESLMGKVLEEAEAFCTKHPKGQHVRWLTSQRDTSITAARATSFALSQAMIAIVVGQRWFSDCASPDEKTKKIQVAPEFPGAALEVTGTAELEDIEIRL